MTWIVKLSIERFFLNNSYWCWKEVNKRDSWLVCWIVKKSMVNDCMTQESSASWYATESERRIAMNTCPRIICCLLSIMFQLAYLSIKRRRVRQHKNQSTRETSNIWFDHTRLHSSAPELPNNNRHFIRNQGGQDTTISNDSQSLIIPNLLLLWAVYSFEFAENILVSQSALIHSQHPWPVNVLYHFVLIMKILLDYGPNATYCQVFIFDSPVIKTDEFLSLDFVNCVWKEPMTNGCESIAVPG